MKSLEDYFAGLISLITSITVIALAILIAISMVIGAIWLLTNGYSWLMDGRGL